MIALVDCVSFFASCEILFRADLEGRAVIVCSPNDGCIVALNSIATACGIKKFEPVFKMKQLIQRNNVIIFSSNFELYGNLSDRVMNIVSSFAHDSEIYSIDESWLDFHGRTDDIREVGHLINNTVKKHTGLEVRFGAGPNKVLSKVASIIAKKVIKANGVCVIDNDDQRRIILSKFPVSSLWGIGRQLSKQLNENNIHTALQLADTPKKMIRRQYNVNVERIARELTGEKCLNFHEDVVEQKQIIVSRSFGIHITELPPLQGITAGYLTKAMEKLRRNDQLVQTMTVSLSTSPFKDNYVTKHKVIQLPAPTSDTLLLTGYLTHAIAMIFTPNVYVKSMVCLTNLCKGEHYQGDLLQEEQSSGSKKLMAILDQVNIGNARNIYIGRTGTSKRFESKREKKSPDYLTSWHELPRIKCI